MSLGNCRSSTRESLRHSNGLPDLRGIDAHMENVLEQKLLLFD